MSQMAVVVPSRSEGRSPRRKGKDWRAQLYPDEREQLAVLDRAITDQKDSLHTSRDYDNLLVLKAKRGKLQVRASQRHRRSGVRVDGG